MLQVIHRIIVPVYLPKSEHDDSMKEYHVLVSTHTSELVIFDPKSGRQMCDAEFYKPAIDTLELNVDAHIAAVHAHRHKPVITTTASTTAGDTITIST